jgi:hypothetical protein
LDIRLAFRYPEAYKTSQLAAGTAKKFKSKEKHIMRRVCGLVSWLIWGMGTALVAVLVWGGPGLLAEQKLNPSTNPGVHNPIQEYGLAGVMLLFSLAATFLRYRLFQKRNRATVDDVGGTFFWLCLISFAVSFSTAAVMLGMQRSLVEDQLRPLYLLAVGSGVCLLAALPLLPRQPST